MGRGINKVILIGNLGKNPETGTISNGSTFATLSVATTDVWRDSTSNELLERTEWHRVVLYGRLAEISRDFLKKGSKVYIEGSLHTRKWQDQKGGDRYATEIQGRSLEMLGRTVTEAPTVAPSPKTLARPEISDINDIDDIPF